MEVSEPKVEPQVAQPAVQAQASEPSAPADRPETKVVQPISQEDEIFSKIETMRDEVLQLYELQVEEQRLAKDLCSVLQGMLSYLSISPEVSSSIFAKGDGEVKEAFIVPQGDVVVAYDRGRRDIKRLEEYSTDVIIKIVKDTIPSIKDLVASRRQATTERINFLDRASNELQNIKQIVGLDPQEAPSDDVVSKIVTPDSS